MKRADIKPGEVYAYQESKYSSTDEIIFLTSPDKDHLYRPNRSRKPDEPYYTLDTHATKPSKGYYHGNTGYLVAIGSNVLKATLEEALTGKAKGVTATYRYSVLIQTTKVIGLYQEVMAARKAREQAAQDASLVRQRECEAASERWTQLLARLTALGVDADLRSSNGMVWNDNDYSRKTAPPRGLMLNAFQAANLAGLLEELKGDR